jgi:hypothetical protein
VCPRVVPELLDERVVFEHLLDSGALHSDAASVHEPQLAKAGLMRCTNVLFDH